MAGSSSDLACLLVGHMRNQVKRACAPSDCVSVDALLRGSLCKRADPEIVTSRILPKDYAAKRQQAAMRRAEAAWSARQRQAADKYMFTGNPYYDNLPDVKARRARYEQAYEEYARSNPAIVQKKSKEEIMRELDAKGPVTSWGDNAFVRGVATVLGAPVKLLSDGIASNISYFTTAPNGMSYSDWMNEYYKNANKEWGTFGHDVANNFQLQANSARHGAAQLGRLVGEYLDPRSYGDSTRARNLKTSYRNTRENAEQAHVALKNRIVSNFDDATLRDADKPGNVIGRLNASGNETFGRLGGETLATMGAGWVARGAGAGINGLTRLASTAVRGPGVAATAGRGARMVASARDMLARGVTAVGDTVSMPFRATGAVFSDPVSFAHKTVTKGIPAFGRGVAQTWHAGIGRPLNVLRHPMTYAQRAIVHPWEAAKGVYRWGRDTLTPAGRVLFSTPAWQAQTWYGAANNAANGNYGRALGDFGTMGLWGMGGKVAIPAMILQHMYGASGGDGDYGQPAAPVYQE